MYEKVGTEMNRISKKVLFVLVFSLSLSVYLSIYLFIFSTLFISVYLPVFLSVIKTTNHSIKQHIDCTLIQEHKSLAFVYIWISIDLFFVVSSSYFSLSPSLSLSLSLSLSIYIEREWKREREKEREMFANSLWDRGSIPSWIIPKTKKIVLDTSLLNTQHYKGTYQG